MCVDYWIFYCIEYDVTIRDNDEDRISADLANNQTCLLLRPHKTGKIHNLVTHNVAWAELFLK